jgi:hypothetical protein
LRAVLNLEQVARRAEVSTATVSRVLNNASVVKHTVRARVLKAIEKLKYHPNLHARSLVGVIIGTTTSETLAAVIMKDPDLGGLPDATPPAVRKLLLRCLNKDPLRRLRDIGEARIALEAHSWPPPTARSMLPIKVEWAPDGSGNRKLVNSGGADVNVVHMGVSSFCEPLLCRL